MENEYIIFKKSMLANTSFNKIYKINRKFSGGTTICNDSDWYVTFIDYAKSTYVKLNIRSTKC